MYYIETSLGHMYFESDDKSSVTIKHSYWMSSSSEFDFLHIKIKDV